MYLGVGCRLFALLWLGQLASAQVYLHNITKPIDGLSSTCIQVMNQAVSCDASLLQMSLSRFESDTTLASLCTTTCTTALTNFLRRVNGACGTSRYNGGDGFAYLASYHGELVYETYLSVCLKNPQGSLCNSVARSVLGINPTDGGLTTLPETSAACNGCVLSSLQLQLQQPLLSGSESSSAYATLTSACKVTTMTPTTPVSNSWVSRISTTATSTPCAGTTVTIKSGDTCQSVSLARGINTYELLNANQLLAYCRNFPAAGASICIPSDKVCKPYRLQTGDTCRSIADSNGITWTQLVTWNLDLGPYCDGLGKMLQEGMVICVSNPGGSWVNPSPGNDPDPTDTNLATDTLFMSSLTPYSAMPTVTSTDVPFPQAEYVPIFANGTRTDCIAYAVAPILVDAYNRTFSYLCEDAAEQYGITMAELQAWNGEALLTEDTGSGPQCYVANARQLCVRMLPYDRSPGITSYCVNYKTAPPGYDCPYFGWRYSANVSSLLEWNPAMNCTGPTSLQKGIEYCAGVEHFRPAGQVSTCNKWAMANDTDPADSPCGIFETKFGLQHARFVAWNPTLKSDCSGIVKNYDYCVSIPGFVPTSAPAAAATAV